MNKNQKNIFIIGMIVLFLLIIGTTIYQKIYIPKKYTEAFCRKFTYENCPDGCQVGPSCEFCQDIGCHSTAFYQNWKKTTNTTQTSLNTATANTNTTTISTNDSCEAMRTKIEDELERANYCKDDSDCDVLMLGGSYIEFGCYHYINKNENKDDIYQQMDEYNSRCTEMINDCDSAPPAKCVNAKCTTDE